ncbi:MAG TPA: glycosyltransferase family 4 protein [Roseiflexaceae bacterium]|nr:glycosyltransferase family 4 protein [Roseiflexaceae bacterium]HMP39250.1 glycosyltransferase family 4 protein [Roseiflexaceae bacterium]
MKILLPVHHFPPRYSAGAELYTLRLARWLQAHGHHAEVACIESISDGAGDRLSITSDVEQGIRVHRASFNIFAAPERRIWDYDNPLLREWFSDLIAAMQPDLAHFQAGYLLGAAPVDAARAAGIPTALTLHDFWFICPRITLQRGDGSLCRQIPADPAGCAWCMKLEQRRFQTIDQLTAGMAGRVMQTIGLRHERRIITGRRERLLATLQLFDAVIAPSQFMADQFAPYVDTDQLHVSRLGLDLARFAAPRPERTDTTLRIGFLGQVAPHKGVHLLVEAVTRLEPQQRVELHIHGGLEARPDYVAQLRRLAGSRHNIFFHGRFESSRAGEILAGLDVAVVPSTWYENSPLAIIEAHAAGLPVITTALGGMAELVRDGIDGLHFRVADAADLTARLQRLIDEPDLLPRLRAGIVAPRSIDTEMNDLCRLYDQLVAQTTMQRTS